MVSRKGGLVLASAAACIAAVGALSATADDIDTSLTTGGVAKLVWGGPIPEPAKPGAKVVYVPSIGLNGAAPEPQVQDFVQEPYVAGVEAPKAHAPLYVAPGEEVEEGEGREVEGEDDAPATTIVATPAIPKAPPPLDKPRTVGKEDAVAAYAPAQDPWDGLKSVTPGAREKGKKKQAAKALPSYASLDPRVPMPDLVPDLPGRGALEDEAPTGYRSLPRNEMQCRRALAKLGVRFTDMNTISRGRSCGVAYPVKVTEIAPGVAMKPSGILNCMTALRVSQWVSNEVKPAAKSKLWKTPTALINASSYRCSRIAGSRTISEHATGNALDVAGFALSNGERFDVRKKGTFDFGEKAFQQRVRQTACRYFGTVLGPGYNRDHADHLHLDLKQRRRGVCK